MPPMKRYRILVEWFGDDDQLFRDTIEEVYEHVKNHPDLEILTYAENNVPESESPGKVTQ